MGMLRFLLQQAFELGYLCVNSEPLHFTAAREIIPPMILRPLSRWYLACALVLAVIPAARAQQPASKEVMDFPAFVHELMQTPNKPGYTGVIWWAPPQFWEESMKRSGIAPDKAHEQTVPLRKYTMIMVATGKIGSGTVAWSAEPQIRDAVRLRDAAGNLYEPLPEVSGPAAGLALILKPNLINMLGATGQGIQILFFAGADQNARPIADPLASGKFSVVVRNLLGEKETTFEWDLPLSALGLRASCPAGGDKVQADWRSCAWRGNRLEQAAAGTMAAHQKAIGE